MSGSDWFDVADPVVRGIVRTKLRVTLSERDDRRANQDALDLVQTIHTEIAKALNAPRGSVSDLTAYAAVVAYHACAQHLRARYPARARLKNKIRYFLTHAPGFAVWEGKDGDQYCGYAGWTTKAPAKSEALHELLSDSTRTGASEVKALDAMRLDDWRQVLETILNHLDGPAALDAVVSIVGSRLRVKDDPEDSEVEPSVRPTIEDELHQREMMKRLWLILQDFEHRWLMAFLLNLPGYTKQARGEIEAFESSGVASRLEIGRLLGITGPEYDKLDAAPDWPQDPGTGERRMTVVWPYLPLEDVAIARALACQKQQVINLRAVAVQKAAKRLRDTNLQGPRSPFKDEPVV